MLDFLSSYSPFVLVLSALICIWWVYSAFFGPLTFWKTNLASNAHNRPGIVHMKIGLPTPGAVWAQEVWESRVRGIFLPIDGVLLLIGRMIPALGFYERWLEVRGHEIEVQAEIRLRRGAKERPVRMREARALVNNYKPFRRLTVEQVYDRMVDVSDFAEDFVERNYEKIQRVNRDAS